MGPEIGQPPKEQEVGPCPLCGWLIDTDECVETHANEAYDARLGDGDRA
jgi:hypothetical protein